MDNHSIKTSIFLPIGTVINGKYTITKQLFTKPFGNIYVANNSKLRENVLIKELYVKNISKRSSDGKSIEIDKNNSEIYAEYIERFNEEAIGLRQVNNSHVVKVTDLFNENNTCYYVTDYVEGELLSQKMTRKNDVLSETEAISYLTQMLEGLNAMHNQGFWHLDINPSNVLVDNNGQIRFVDFGHCKLVDNEATVIATANHDPIELQSLDLNNIGPWTDFYELGATLYNIITGKIPPSASDINEATTSLYKFPSNISKKTQRLILWMMTPNIFRRPQDIGEIKDFLYGIPSISASGTQAVPGKKAPKDNKSQKSSDEDTDGLSNKTLKAMQIFIFASVLILLGFLGYKYLFNNESDSEDDEKNVVNLVKEKPVDDKSTPNNTEQKVDSINADTAKTALPENRPANSEENKTSQLQSENKSKETVKADEPKEDSPAPSQSATEHTSKADTETSSQDKNISETSSETDNTNKTSENKTLIQEEKPKTDVKQEVKPSKYNVVVGSFGTKENADSRANELKAKGYSVSVKYMDSNKMYRVVVQGVDEQDKNRIKETYSDAWTE